MPHANSVSTANAITLYPQQVCRSYQYRLTGVASPREIFEIILTSSASDGSRYSYTASLVAGHALARSIAARGPKSTCLTSALEGLLHVTSEALGWYTETLLGEIKNKEETDKGVVNFGMVEDGFHFAHVQRAMAVQAQV